MDHDEQKQNDARGESVDDHHVRNFSEAFGNMRKPSESFGNIPKASEAFGSFPQRTESESKINGDAEPETVEDQMQSLRTEFHTLTVKDAARRFEEAGVARTERSVVNWCQANKDGVPRLDCYFDRNERRYFITPQSVNAVIEEEKARQFSHSPSTPPSEPSTGEHLPKGAEAATSNWEARFSRSRDADLDELKAEIEMLQVENRVKSAWIKQLKAERGDILSELRKADYQIGSLETQLRLDAPRRAETDERSPTENSSQDKQGYQEAVIDDEVEGDKTEPSADGGGVESEWDSI